MRKTKIAAVHIGTQTSANQLRETHMNKVSFPSDSIALKAISTGGNSAGNGGDGINTGNISNSPSIKFDTYNKAEGADVHVNTGDKVYQKAYWDANAKADDLSKAHGGSANSNGDQSSKSGHDTSNVDASTTASQTNILSADQHQTVMAGIGGNGGNDNTAKGGEVDIKASIESANLSDVLNHSEHFHVDDFVHV
jgi:hypothetical protein